MSATVWHRGVPWYDRALESAERRNPWLADDVSVLAYNYRAGTGSFTQTDELDRATGQPIPGRVRVSAHGVSAIISEPGAVVIGFVDATEAQTRPMEAPRAASRPRRAYKPGKARRRGPKDVPELLAWLRADGYTEGPTAGSGHRTILRGEQVVYTLPSTASDNRSFANCVADLRRLTGLELRR